MRPPTDQARAAKPGRSTSKQCTLWVHEEHSFKEDVIFNKGIFPEGHVQIGDVVEILAIEACLHGKAREAVRETTAEGSDQRKPGQKNGRDASVRPAKNASREGEGSCREEKHARCRKQPTASQRRYLFIVDGKSSEQKIKQSNLQISIAAHIANLFGFRNRMQVQVSVVDKAQNSASHVELAFRDEYLSRSDMWRLAIAELSQKTMYKGQKLIFIGSIKARIKNVYVRGQRVSAAYFAADTKPIFRSETARHVLFLQMSKEMWEFDSDGSGEIMFNKVINGFLPELFKRWEEMNARHLVSIVLFTRVEYDEDPAGLAAPDTSAGGLQSIRRRHHEDYYRVVTSEAASLQWSTILETLKKEFRIFWRDISLHSLAEASASRSLTTSVGDQGASRLSGHPVLGKPSAAFRGNVLEAISLASSQFSEDYVDRDLVRTGLSVVIVTPSVGFFEVDDDMLRWTTENLTNNGVGVDLVCLSRMPLHSVPLFKYRNPALPSSVVVDAQIRKAPEDGPGRDSSPELKVPAVRRSNSSLLQVPASSSDASKSTGADEKTEPWIYAVPSWIDISYWASATEIAAGQVQDGFLLGHSRLSHGDIQAGFIPRAKMYELQMMGIMENEMSNISLPYLYQSSHVVFMQDKHSYNPSQGAEMMETQHASHESPNARDGLQSTGHEGSATTAKIGRHGTPTQTNKRRFDWMDEHDEQRFRPLQQQLQESIREVTPQKVPAKQHPQAGREEPSTRDSSKSHGQVVAKDESVTGKAFLERKMRERLSEAERAPTRQNSKKVAKEHGNRSSPMPYQLGNRRTSRHLVQLKAIASTEVNSEHAISGALPSRVHPDQFGSPITQRARSDAGSDERGSMSLKEHVPSRPIPIRQPTKAGEQDPDTETNATPDGNAYNGNIQQTRKIDVLQAASIVKQAGPRLDLASGAPEVSQTLPPTSALAPWLNMLNPSHPRKEDTNPNAQFGRWQHVFPHAVRAATVKWKSLCSPAAVPLTTQCFPTAAQLALEYHENPYTVSLDEEEDLSELPRDADGMFRELIGMRLAQGFQFVVGDAVAEALRQPLLKTSEILSHDYVADDAAMMVMSLGNTIHQMQRVGGGEVEIKRFVRKPTSTAVVTPARDGNFWTYKICIRTSLAADYEPRQLTFNSTPEEYNWNYVDSFLAGHSDSYTEQLRFWRARFVLIPVEQPIAVKSSAQVMHEDNEEEIRIEGIRKFTQLLQRCRYVSPEDRRLQGRARDQLDANPLDIIYQTRDPSAVVAAELDVLPLLESDSGNRRSKLFSEEEPFQRTNMNLQTLAQEIQGEKGVLTQDRRWHWRLHYNCFIGSEMTTWLLENFADVDTREEAVDLGNELMRAGLFQHVEKRHQFRDGNFFYQLGVEYRSSRAESRRGWFGSRKVDRSIPSTPASDVSRDSPQQERARGPAADSVFVDAEATNQPGGSKRLKVALSKMMRYDIDQRKRSYRPEIINLHYDRLHHPDNCYHLRIDWMNVTAKLIEDAIVTWATTVEKYGLRLVEVPIREVSSIAETHPLRSPYGVKLAKAPPASQPQYFFDAESLAPRTKPDPLFYHKAIMKRFGFVLDIEAATNFPANVEVTYSWGKPDYRYNQYIHRSGLLLAQITDAGDFLLLANRLYNNRSAGSSDRFERSEARDRRSGHYLSPFASPLVRATHDPSLSNSTEAGAPLAATTAEELKERFEDFCGDAQELQRFYDEVLSKVVSPSLTTTVLEASIPSLGLPPSVAPRETSSPATSATLSAAGEVKDANANADAIGNESLLEQGLPEACTDI